MMRLDEVAYAGQKKHRLCLVLDNVRSAHNVGAAFRTADAFLVEQLYLCGITPMPPHPSLRKTALGAERVVAWQHVEKIVSALTQLKQEGYTLVAVEQVHGALPLDQLNITVQRPCALVFGNEVFGVCDEALALVDYAVEIPQHGTKQSLNVATCIGIVAWEISRGQRPA